MDVVTPEQARIAEAAGATAVMALERVPADIRAQGGVARMSDPKLIASIQEAVSIPVMAKCRIGHFVEAQILEHLGIDVIDESEVLSPADFAHHVDKRTFKTAFVCGATNLGEALRRINEGAAMIRSKGEAGTGDVSEATRHIRKIRAEIGEVHGLYQNNPEELFAKSKELAVPYELLESVAREGKAARAAADCRWHRHACRRCHDDAARRRRRVRGLRHFHVRQSRKARRCNREGNQELHRSRCHHRGVHRPGQGDGRHHCRRTACTSPHG